MPQCPRSPPRRGQCRSHLPYRKPPRRANARLRRILPNPARSGGGWLRLWTGAPDLAIKHFETALRLSPRDRLAGSFMAIGVGHFFARRFEEAASMLLRSLQEHAGWAPTYRFLAACYAQMGQLDEAQETVRRLRAVTPVIVPSAAHWRKPEHRELFLSGLRLAAGEKQ